jgi:hypothetical protein
MNEITYTRIYDAWDTAVLQQRPEAEIERLRLRAWAAWFELRARARAV